MADDDDDVVSLLTLYIRGLCLRLLHTTHVLLEKLSKHLKNYSTQDLHLNMLKKTKFVCNYIITQNGN